jgi:hypothetical protein
LSGPTKTTTAAAGTKYAPLVNNLDLEGYVGIGNPYYYGNNFDTNGHSIPNPGTLVFDAVNNVEEIIIPANTYSTGTGISLMIGATALMGDALNPNVVGGTLEQDFALFGYNIH